MPIEYMYWDKNGWPHIDHEAAYCAMLAAILSALLADHAPPTDGIEG